MMRKRTGAAPNTYFLLALVCVVAVCGYAILSLYSDVQSKSALISQQSDEIESKSRQISFLQATVRNQTDTISSQEADISELQGSVRDLSVRVGDLSGRLGIATQEISELTPKVRNYYVVGVRSDGDGVVVPIEAKVSRGSGAISANINKVEFLPGTQDSIRIAAGVASAYTGVPISDRDVTVSFVNSGSDVVTVDGGSAGGAITVAIIAALSEKSPSSSVLMTGAIYPNGQIGPIGSVQAKAEAARSFGASKFLAPAAQVVDVPGIDIIGVATIQDVVGEVLESSLN